MYFLRGVVSVSYDEAVWNSQDILSDINIQGGKIVREKGSIVRLVAYIASPVSVDHEFGYEILVIMINSINSYQSTAR